MGRRNKEDEYNLFYEKICKTIKEQMKERFIKQKEMAECIGVSYSTFANKINNLGAKFNLWELKNICEELLISIDELIMWSEE